MKINSLVYELCNAENSNFESVYKCKNMCEKLSFFKNTNQKLEELTQDADFAAYFINAFDAFKDFRGSIKVIFLTLEKNLTRELQKSSNDLVDEQFHDQVIKPHKTRLRSLEETKHLLPEFERSFIQPRNYSTSTSTSTGGYWTMEPEYSYVQKEN